jgi:hypothetical protein
VGGHTISRFCASAGIGWLDGWKDLRGLQNQHPCCGTLLRDKHAHSDASTCCLVPPQIDLLCAPAGIPRVHFLQSLIDLG